MSSPRIGKLEALLARIKSNASAPRTHKVEAAAPVAAATKTPEPARVEKIETPIPPKPREIEVPLESRARLMTAPRTQAEVEEIEAEEVLELDDRHIVKEDTPAPPPTASAPRIDAFAATTEMNVKNLDLPPAKEPDIEVDVPPPSSRRPIAEPAETPQEAQISVMHTPPPESGKQVAADVLSFDDDLTGVREAPAPRAATPAAEPSIQLQSLRSPPTAQPAPPDEMEVDLSGHTSEATAPPPSPNLDGPLPELRAPRVESAEHAAVSEPIAPEVSRPTRPVAAQQIAEMAGTVKPASPKTFGELLDLTLAL